MCGISAIVGVVGRVNSRSEERVEEGEAELWSRSRSAIPGKRRAGARLLDKPKAIYFFSIFLRVFVAKERVFHPFSFFRSRMNTQLPEDLINAVLAKSAEMPEGTPVVKGYSHSRALTT